MLPLWFQNCIEVICKRRRAPIRRTTEYLESGKIVFREAVKIFSISFDHKEKHHEGARDFVFWHLPQIQYKNPKVQCLTLKTLTPTPFIKIYFEDTRTVLIDLDSRTRDDILDHLVNFIAVCKTVKELQKEIQISERKTHPSVFGYGCERHCICEILGQVPCPEIVMLPYCWRGKTRKGKKLRIPPCYMEPGLQEEEEEE